MKHLLAMLVVLLLFGKLSSAAQTPPVREPLPIPLGRTKPAPPPLTNLPPFESVYERKPPAPAPVAVPSPAPGAPSKPPPVQPEDAPTPVPTAPVAPEAVAPDTLPTTPTAPTGSPEERKARTELLVKIVSTAVQQAQKYNQTFRDLSGEERRLSERLDHKGEVKQQRRVVSDLIVYQSRLEAEMAYEYRNIKAVDDKPIKQDEKHLEKFFQRLLKAKSARAELDLMNDEGFKHDLPVGGLFYGLTLFQWREILPFALADVGFDLLGREVIAGRETVVILFRQQRANRKLEWNLTKGLGLERGRQFVRGRLWLDAKTMQIWQAERELTLLFPGEKEVVPIWRQTLSYKASPFGIFVPDKFVAEFFYHFGRAKDGNFASVLSGRLTTEYGEFKRFDVTSEEQKEKTILKDETKPPAQPIRK